jgi:hypothetical protein
LRNFSGPEGRTKESCKKKGRKRPGRTFSAEEKPGNVAFPEDFSSYLRALPVSEVEISGIAV